MPFLLYKVPKGDRGVLCLFARLAVDSATAASLEAGAQPVVTTITSEYAGRGLKMGADCAGQPDGEEEGEHGFGIH